ncbi:MAG: hypothetical protein WAQ57_03550 [Candidatus Saccharimonadales bacterium]
MSLAEQHAPDMQEFEKDFREEQQTNPAGEHLVEEVVIEPVKVLWHAISVRAFDQYRVMRHSSHGAIVRRNRFAQEFAKLELLHPNIVRGEE